MMNQQHQTNTLFNTCPSFGDAIMSRWVLRDCDKTYRVITRYHFLFEGLKIKPIPPNLLPDTLVTKEHREILGGDLYISYPTGMKTRAATNAAASISRCGSVLGAMISNSGQHPEKCYRDLPPVTHWQLLGNTENKPIVVINPNISKNAQQTELMPLSEYLITAASMLKKRGYFIVVPSMISINGLELDGELPYADLDVSSW